MGATEEQTKLLSDAHIDHVSYVLILYSIAFILFLCKSSILPPLLVLGILPMLTLYPIQLSISSSTSTPSTRFPAPPRLTTTPSREAAARKPTAPDHPPRSRRPTAAGL